MTTAETDKKLGVLTVGMGSVATTLYAGIELARRSIHFPIGSITQVDFFSANSEPAFSLSEQLGLMKLDALCFGGFDILEEDAFQAAQEANVLSTEDLEKLRDHLSSIQAYPGIHNEKYLPQIAPTRYVKGTFTEQIISIRNSIRDFIRLNKCTTTILILCHSTEAFFPEETESETIEDFEVAIEKEKAHLSPSQLYTYAALMEGVSVINGTPNPVLSNPALLELAKSQNLCLAGSDLKSGQTYIKSVLAEAIRDRMLGVRGWFSTNILGNRDGQVLDNPKNLEAKKHTKRSVLDSTFPSSKFPHHYTDIEHQVHIHYFPPKGDNKEAWDSIQLFGWMGYEMEMKINFQCKDSILAAPMILDLVLLMEYAQRNGESGVIDWLSTFFKYPNTYDGSRLEYLHREQLKMLHQKISRWLQSKEG